MTESSCTGGEQYVVKSPINVWYVVHAPIYSNFDQKAFHVKDKGQSACDSDSSSSSSTLMTRMTVIRLNSERNRVNHLSAYAIKNRKKPLGESRGNYVIDI